MRGPYITSAYFDFVGLGDASHDGLSSVLDGTNPVFTFDHDTFNGCGQIPSASIYGGATVFSLTNSTWINSVGPIREVAPIAMTFNADPSALTTGTRLISHNWFYSCRPDAIHARDFTITNNYFDESWLSAGSYPWVSFDGNFLRKQGTEESQFEGNVSNCYFLDQNSSGGADILHAGHLDHTISQNVFQYTGTLGGANAAAISDTEGAPLGYPTVTQATTTIVNNIFLPVPSPGEMPLGGITSNTTNPWTQHIVIDHNTVFTNTGPSIWLGATVGARQGSIPSLRSNIFYRFGTGTSGYAIYNIDPSPRTDVVTASLADYNGWVGLAKLPAGTWNDVADGTVYSTPMSGTTPPGVHDKANVDPQFTDPSRNLQKWDASLGGSGTIASACLVFSRIPRSRTRLSCPTFGPALLRPTRRIRAQPMTAAPSARCNREKGRAPARRRRGRRRGTPRLVRARILQQVDRAGTPRRTRRRESPCCCCNGPRARGTFPLTTRTFGPIWLN